MTWQHFTKQWIMAQDYISLDTRLELANASDDKLISGITTRLGQSSLAVFTLDICQQYKLGKITN